MPTAASLSPVVNYHGLARRHLLPLGLLMRPRLNGGTLAGPITPLVPSLKRKLLARGDVLKTHPHEEYWGCAVVLTARDAVDSMDPMCHIAVTPVVFGHDFSMSELQADALSVLEFERSVRLSINEVAHRTETCISIYSRKHTSAVHVIGAVDPARVFASELEFRAGNGSDGGWPFSGPVAPSLGNEAVHSWRAQHDRDRWQNEIDAASKHERMLRRITRTRS